MNSGELLQGNPNRIVIGEVENEARIVTSIKVWAKFAVYSNPEECQAFVV